MKGGGLWDPTSVREENKIFLVNVWKPLCSIHIFKTSRESLKRKGTTSASGVLGPLHFRLVQKSYLIKFHYGKFRFNLLQIKLNYA